ncbi:hypothetical protein WHT83_17930 [Aminobacter sp. P9b]|uniref:hypothetical protein n=1 Tax=Aminobacter sp. P9b TaxID=3133697 RepID=UPI003255C599
MYNTDLPNRADLPSSAQLKRSTIIAAATAFVLLITVVMPSEYAIDPTRVGRLLGLTTMGEIKTQLAGEAAADAAGQASTPTSARPTAVPPDLSARLDRIEGLLLSLAAQQPALPTKVSQTPNEVVAAAPVQEEVVEEPVAAAPEPVSPPVGRADEMSFTLTPGQGVEVKLVMRQGAKAIFAWAVEGGVVNFDTHGDGGGQSVSYEKGRSTLSDEGELEAAFDGNHGWFWRNRGTSDVTVTLRTQGDYIDIKRVI